MKKEALEAKLNEIEQDLEKSYKDFFFFSIDLVQDIDNKNNNLKFAVVNMQIALELFLKYYFLKKGKFEWLFSNINKFEFQEFSSILNRFYSKDNELLVTKKKHLQNILEARNKIVHTGKNNWNNELVINLINTTLFIQNVLNKEFNETLFQTSYDPNNKLSKNEIWKVGTEDFAKNIANLNNANVYECWFCLSHSFIDKNIFNYDEVDEKGFQCITCLNALYEDYQIGIAKCICGENTFVLDCLNVQNDEEYFGKCLNCDVVYHAYKCENCTKYFLDFDNERIVKENKIYCSQICSNEKKGQLTAVSRNSY